MRTRKSHLPSPLINAHAQRGVTLIEALVTLLIVAFGLLGVAALLVKSTSLASTAYARTVVTQKIYALADRMRNNPDGASFYDTNGAAASCSTGAATCAATACTPEQMAAYDLCQWSDEVKGAMPNGKGEVKNVTATGAKNPVFTVTVTWDSPGGVAGQLHQNAANKYSLNVANVGVLP